MNYNEELNKLKQLEEELLKKAEKEGYRLVNGQLTKETFIPVIEIYARAESDYESYGHFYMFKKTVPLTQKQLEMIKSLEQTQKGLIDGLIYPEDEDILDGKEYELFNEILEVGRMLDEEDIDRIVEKENLDEEYYLEKGQNLYLEFFFHKDNLDGYISVYDLPVEELEKQPNIETYFHKTLTLN